MINAPELTAVEVHSAITELHLLVERIGKEILFALTLKGVHWKNIQDKHQVSKKENSCMEKHSSQRKNNPTFNSMHVQVFFHVLVPPAAFQSGHCL
jgi:hypothetical protein